MSEDHGGPVTLKPIGEVAQYLKNLIPADIPGSYTLKPALENVASADNIRNGVLAFRDFLYLMCDRLISDGHLYAKPPKKPKTVDDYPFIPYVANLLVEMGYHGILSDNGGTLLINELPSCAGPKPKIPPSSQAECLRFLTLSGFVFTGKKVTYPADPGVLTGLKALAVAEIELRTTRRYWGDKNMLRCDYRLLKAEDPDMLDVLKDFLHPLPEEVQTFALKLHQRYTYMGMICSMRVLGDINFAYAFISKSKKAMSPTDIYSLSLWQFSISMKYGYCLVMRPKKADKYADIIAQFPLSLQELIAKGYGCDRKLRNEPCQHGCQGIRIPLDDSILAISRDIETWLDSEISHTTKK